MSNVVIRRAVASSCPQPRRVFEIENLEDRRLFSISPLALGLNTTNVNNANYKSLVTLLRESGTTTVRLWYGFSSYTSPGVNKIVTFAEKFKHDGFDVTMSVVPNGGITGTAAQTKSLFSQIVAIPGLAASVDRWEIGNEEDSATYWKGTLKTYVDDYLRPASMVLHAYGAKVVSGGVSWNPADIQTLVTDGMLQYVDYVGYHPYSSSLSELKTNVAKVESIVGDVPLVASEWNVRGYTSMDASAWAAAIKSFWPTIRDNFYAAYYFCGITMDTPAGPAGVMNPDGTPNEPFWSTYLSFQDSMPAATASSGSSSAGSTTTVTTPTGTTTSGSTASTGSTATGSTSTGTSKTTSSGSGTTVTTTSTSSGKTSTSSAGTTPTASNSSASSEGVTVSKGTTTPSKSSQPVAVKRPKPVPVAPAISSVSLLNATSDTVASGYSILPSTVNVDVAATGNYLSLLASGNKSVGSVKFTINGTSIVDSAGPFTLFGEKHHDIVGSIFKPGTYTIVIQPYSGSNAKGTAGVATTYTLDVIDSGLANTAVAPPMTYRAKTLSTKTTVSTPGTIGVLSGVKVAAKKKKKA